MQIVHSFILPFQAWSFMICLFSEINMDILRGLDSLNAGSKNYLNENLMKKIVVHYGADNIQISETLLSFDIQIQ